MPTAGGLAVGGLAVGGLAVGGLAVGGLAVGGTVGPGTEGELVVVAEAGAPASDQTHWGSGQLVVCVGHQAAKLASLHH